MDLQPLVQEVIRYFNTTETYQEHGQTQIALLSHCCRIVVERRVRTLTIAFNLIRQLSEVGAPAVSSGGNFNAWVKPLVQMIADSLEAYIFVLYPETAIENQRRLKLI